MRARSLTDQDRDRPCAGGAEACSTQGQVLCKLRERDPVATEAAQEDMQRQVCVGDAYKSQAVEATGEPTLQGLRQSRDTALPVSRSTQNVQRRMREGGYLTG
jgi:hypothetical protein